MSYKAVEIANTFIHFGLRDNKPLTNMQLHKLLYYSQGWYLVTGEKPLFDEEFKKWMRIPIGTNAVSSMKSNINSRVTRTLIPELRER